MNRNRAPRIVPISNTWGVRKNCSSVRRVVWPAAVKKPAPVVGDAGVTATSGTDEVIVVMSVSVDSGGIRALLRGGVVVGGLEVLSREREEHLVEGGSA